MTVACTIRSSSIISTADSGIETLHLIWSGGIGHNSHGWWVYITIALHVKYILVVCGNIIIFPRSSYVEFVLWHLILAVVCLS